MLEVKVILHPATGGPPREIANMEIAQVEQGAESLRDYSVFAWYQPPVVRGGKARRVQRAAVHGHDRNGTPWELVRKAIEALK